MTKYNSTNSPGFNYIKDNLPPTKAFNVDVAKRKKNFEALTAQNETNKKPNRFRTQEEVQKEAENLNKLNPFHNKSAQQLQSEINNTYKKASTPHYSQNSPGYQATMPQQASKIEPIRNKHGLTEDQMEKLAKHRITLDDLDKIAQYGSKDMSVYYKENNKEPEFDEKKARRKQNVAGVTDAVSMLAKMWAAGKGAYISPTDQSQSALSKVMAEDKAERSKYDQLKNIYDTGLKNAEMVDYRTYKAKQEQVDNILGGTKR